MRLHTINLYRLRHSALILRAARNLAAAIILALAGYGAWWSMTNYIEADERVEKAKRNEQEAMALLSGKVQEVERHGEYARIIKYERQQEWVKVEK